MLMALVMSHSVFADVETLLAKVAEAYGGKARIAEVKAYKQEGVTFSVLRGKEGKVLRAFRYPDHLRIEIGYGTTEHELRLLAGVHSWKQDAMVGEPFYSAMLLQATRLAMPAPLFDHQQHVRDIGTITGKNGQTLRALEMQFHGHMRVILGIDGNSGRILESTGIIDSGGFRMEFGTTYDDFRVQDGRLFAFKEEHYAMGQKTGYTRLAQIEIAKELPDELFFPSQAKPEKPKTLTQRFLPGQPLDVVLARSDTRIDKSDISLR